MRRNRIASVAVALLLVLSALGGGLGPASVTQTASADFSEDCDFSNYSFSVASVTNAVLGDLMGYDDGCQWDSGTASDYDNVTASDAYTEVLSIKDAQNSYTTTAANFQQNTRTVAYSKAKIAVVQALENESGASVMAQEANESVRDYYARQQADIITDYNAKMNQLQYINSSAPGVLYASDSLNTAGSYPLGESLAMEVKYRNYTLVNGSTVEAAYYGTSGNSAGLPSQETYGLIVTADNPNNDGPTEAFNATKYQDRLDEVASQKQQVEDNMWQYAQGVETQYDAGELNATTLVQNDPALIASEASTSFNSTGYYGYASAQLASIGYGGDLNQSHVVQINGGNYTGTLFYSGSAGTEFQTGQTYDFANYSGTFYLAASDTPTNKTGIVQLDDKGSSFTILEATNTQTGEAVNSTVTEKYVYESANASNLQSEIDRLEQLREFYEEQNTGGGGIPIGSDDKLIIGIVAAAVIVLALRN